MKWTPVPQSKLIKSSANSAPFTQTEKAISSVHVSSEIPAASGENNDSLQGSKNVTTDKSQDSQHISGVQGPSNNFNIRSHFSGPIHFGVPVTDVIPDAGRSRLFPPKKTAAPPNTSTHPNEKEPTQQHLHPVSLLHPLPHPLPKQTLHHFFNQRYITLIESFMQDKNAQINLVITNIEGEPHVKVTHNHFLAPTFQPTTPLKTSKPASAPTSEPSTPLKTSNKTPSASTNEPTTTLKTYTRKQPRPTKAIPTHLNLPPTPDFAASPPSQKARKYVSVASLIPLPTKDSQPSLEIPTNRIRKPRSTRYLHPDDTIRP